MFQKSLPIFLAAALFALPVSAVAAEVESGQVYCFTAEDFASEEDALTGICITDVPRDGSTVQLGSRILRPGDVLTADQAAQMTFTSRWTERDTSSQFGYLPIFADSVAPETTVCLSIRGREDKPPVAEDSTMETYKNMPNTGKLKVRDPEDQPMTYAVTRQPKRGTVTVNEDGSFTYTPKKNKVGIDSFVYTASDPAGKVSREATVTITILKPSGGAQYTDTAGKECCFAAEWMRNTGIFSGETLAGNTCFNPDKTVTRGEFLSMLVKTMDIPVEEELTYTGYTDSVPGWLKPYVAAAVRSGLTSALPGRDCFGAEETVTTEEAAAILCCALDLEYCQDEEAAAAENGSALQTVRENGFALEDNRTLTRSQAAMVLYQAAQMMQENSF